MPLSVVAQLLAGRDFRLGRISIDGKRIQKIELDDGFAGADSDIHLPNAYAGPGFIDLQVNGAAGCDFTSNASGLPAAADFLPSAGVTAFLPTLVTAEPETLRSAASTLGEVIASQKGGARILGIHLEGPFINPAYGGAHDRRFIRPPSIQELETLRAASQGAIRMVTLAPELPGAAELIDWLRGRNIVVSAGHSAATYEQATAAFQAGVGCVTHIFNGQPPMLHRAPGLAGAALVSPGLPVGLIADGVHVHPSMCAMVYRSKGPENVCLVSDAVAAVGAGAGTFQLGSQSIEADQTAARTRQGALAGSLLTLDRAVANMARFTGSSLAEAWRMASAVPARILKLPGRGVLRPGAIADVTVLSPDFEVLCTIIEGELAYMRGQEGYFR